MPSLPERTWGPTGSVHYGQATISGNLLWLWDLWRMRLENFCYVTSKKSGRSKKRGRDRWPSVSKTSEVKSGHARWQLELCRLEGRGWWSLKRRVPGGSATLCASSDLAQPRTAERLLAFRGKDLTCGAAGFFPPTKGHIQTVTVGNRHSEA